jgi:hypothetical protein
MSLLNHNKQFLPFLFDWSCHVSEQWRLQNKTNKMFNIEIIFLGENLPVDIFFYLSLTDDNLPLTAFLRTNETSKVKLIHK